MHWEDLTKGKQVAEAPWIELSNRCKTRVGVGYRSPGNSCKMAEYIRGSRTVQQRKCGPHGHLKFDMEGVSKNFRRMIYSMNMSGQIFGTTYHRTNKLIGHT